MNKVEHRVTLVTYGAGLGRGEMTNFTFSVLIISFAVMKEQDWVGHALDQMLTTRARRY